MYHDNNTMLNANHSTNNSLPSSQSTAACYSALTNSSTETLLLSGATSFKVCIGIGGGVGPAAGLMLHKKIVEATISDGTDQSHCEVHHVSRPGVADRTAYLLGKSNDSPAPGMATTMAALKASALLSGNNKIVTGVPCNTFHAPRIWEEFTDILRQDGTDEVVEVLHMLDETAKVINVIVPMAKKIGLLSTTGTRECRVYHDILEPLGYEVVEVDPAEQCKVHDAIYNRSWGLKAVQPTTPEAFSEFERFADMLLNKGAEAIILGCTEIPLALPQPHIEGVVLIDPMEVLAKACVEQAGSLAHPLPMSPMSLRNTPEWASFTELSKKRAQNASTESFEGLLMT
eukprot:Rhum_TRINITY_DN15527_c0_g1::Rhum_TRINITY_DN15527_c0_g1_i1::g.161115::m.161115/K01779/racD; aspartate racemase